MSELAKALAPDPVGPPLTGYVVLIIEFANDPPRVMIFSSFDDAEAALDVFEVTVFDPPYQDNVPERALLRARIFECKGEGCGVEIDIGAARENRHVEWMGGNDE